MFKIMEIFIDIFRSGSTNDVWNALHEMGFTAKMANEWYTKRYDIDTYEEIKDILEKLPDTIIIHGEGPTLIKLQRELTEAGVNELTPKVLESNLFFTYMTIHHFDEQISPDASHKTSTDEPSASNTNDQPQS